MSKSSTTTELPELPPVHPGTVLREDVLEELGLAVDALAASLGVSTVRIANVLAARSPIDAELALRLSRYLGTSAAFWMGLQSDFDLEQTQREQADRINSEVVPLALASS